MGVYNFPNCDVLRQEELEQDPFQSKPFWDSLQTLENVVFCLFWHSFTFSK